MRFAYLAAILISLSGFFSGCVVMTKKQYQTDLDIARLDGMLELAQKRADILRKRENKK